MVLNSKAREWEDLRGKEVDVGKISKRQRRSTEARNKVSVRRGPQQLQIR